ncbi:aminotransferase class IV family protein [Bacteroidota bacterium]
MYPLFETIKVSDGRLLHLQWHQKRVNHSFKMYYNRTFNLVLEDCINVPDHAQNGVYKCRMLYNEYDFKIAFEPYAPRQLRSLRLVHSDDIDYSLKFTDRSQLEELLAKRGECDDILIVRKGFITDTSYANVAFYDTKGWYTPAHPLLKGTKRNRLIEEGKLAEKDIRIRDLGDYKVCRLINAMLGFDSSNEIDLNAIQG